MKTFNIKDVYSWSNAEEARQYIGTFGYFSNVCFGNLREWEYGELEQINPNNYISGIFSENHGSGYGLFIPEDKVKEVEEIKEEIKEDKKKYRPFNNQGEIRDYFDRMTMIGYVLGVQDKYTSKRFMLQVIGSFEDGLVLPIYGTMTWEQLFAYFILYKDGKKRPFGIEVEND